MHPIAEIPFLPPLGEGRGGLQLSRSFLSKGALPTMYEKTRTPVFVLRALLWQQALLDGGKADMLDSSDETAHVPPPPTYGM